jgi:PhzF family phenazine biosynthesis protein
MSRDILRYAAFTVDGQGGNPAGIVLDATGMTAGEMLCVAAEVGYSETAFLVPRRDEPGTYDVRYFAPEREVPFCGHATIAAAVALAEREGPAELTLRCRAGDVRVATMKGPDGVAAELTSVPPTVQDAEPALVDAALHALRWSPDDLDPGHPPAVAGAGARHLVLVTRTRDRLGRLDYDVPGLTAVMRAADLTTLQLVWPEGDGGWSSRNPFPVGGVVEDPATGAAAAALGAYLRLHGFVVPPAQLTVHQGVDLGRPSTLEVALDADRPGVRVRGRAVPMP